LSVGVSTENDYETLKTRFYSRLSSGEREKFKEAIHLFPTVKEVSDYNYFKLQQMISASTGNPVPVARIPAQNNCSDSAAKDEAEGLPNVINLAVGGKVMFRTNLWTSKGAIGHVVDILYDEKNSSPDSSPEVIICSFPSYTGPCLDDSLKTIPIPAITRYWTTERGVQCSRKQFPLNVSYARTIPKSQGLTLSLVIIFVYCYHYVLSFS
jgi:hypothetical protein